MLVYQITNLDNGKLYIGKSKRAIRAFLNTRDPLTGRMVAYEQ